MSRLRSVAIIAVMALGSALAMVSGASAGGLDQGYGQQGILSVSPPLPAGSEAEISTLKVAPGGAMYDLVRTQPCREASCARHLLFRYEPNGELDHRFGERGVAVVPRFFADLSLDGKGRPVLTQFGSPKIERLTREGRPDKSFGGSGSVKVGGLNRIDEVLPAPGGGLFAVSDSELGDEDGIEFPQERPVALSLLRLGSNGKPDRRFGHRGFLAITLPPQGGPLAVTSKGGVLVPGLEKGGTIALSLISPRGRLNSSFDANARAAGLQVPTLNFGYTFMLPLAGGGVEVLGANSEKGGYAVRLRPDGRLDKRFGSGGHQRLGFDPAAAAAVADGSVYALSKPELVAGESPVFAFRLDPDGTVDPGFNGGAPLSLPEAGEFGRLTPISGNAAVVTSGGQYCNGTCDTNPYAARLVG